MSLQRFGRFNLVGAAGIVVQMAILSICLHGLSVHYLAATVVAVAAAVLHNFLWHWRWTWKDRGIPARSAAEALARFAFLNGGVSVVTNLVVMRLLVGEAGVPAEPAGLLAIAAGGVCNYHLGDRLVFRRG